MSWKPATKEIFTILTVSSSAQADLKIVSAYRATALAACLWFSARPDWRTNTLYALFGIAGGALDAVGGSGLASSVVLSAETRDAVKRESNYPRMEAAAQCWIAVQEHSGCASKKGADHNCDAGA